MVDSFLRELLLDGFPAGIAYIRVPTEPSQDDTETDIKEKAKHASIQLSTGEAHSNYGMKYLIS